ncbi:MAG: F0F1 ATP synthase subunit B [Hyphomicrobiaceae bacterium]
MLQMAEFWVAVAFVAFVLVLLYYRVPRLISKALDERAEAIRKELDEARRLREEAQALLADYQKKHRNVGQETDVIVETARREAEALANETRASLTESLERRTRMAEEKIERAEAQALDEVRASAIDVAVAAAEKILREKMAAGGDASLVDQSIRDLRGRLN